MDTMDNKASYNRAAGCNGRQHADLQIMGESLQAMNTKLAEANLCLEAAFDISGWSATDPAQGIQKVVNAALFIALLRHRLTALATFYDSSHKAEQGKLIAAQLKLARDSYTQNARWVFDAGLVTEPRWDR